jgi:hypothetical protein
VQRLYLGQHGDGDGETAQVAAVGPRRTLSRWEP